MFSLAYGLLPFSDRSPAEAIRASLARYQRGGRGEVPDEWLTFDDETEHVRALHEGEFTFSRAEGGGTEIEGGDVTYLDFSTVAVELAARPARPWTIRFVDREPNLATFAERYVRDLERHSITGGYGRWLNALGHWDWWDLGGRFDGRIIGERGRAGRSASTVSSGPSRGRSMLNNVAGALSEALGSPPGNEVVVEADNNIELVSRLLEDARAGREHAFPAAVLLPPGSAGDEERWVGSWPEIGPADSLARLGLPANAGWPDIVIAAYARFPEHWAAGVAFHL